MARSSIEEIKARADELSDAFENHDPKPGDRVPRCHRCWPSSSPPGGATPPNRNSPKPCLLPVNSGSRGAKSAKRSAPAARPHANATAPARNLSATPSRNLTFHGLRTPGCACPGTHFVADAGRIDRAGGSRKGTVSRGELLEEGSRDKQSGRLSRHCTRRREYADRHLSPQLPCDGDGLGALVLDVVNCAQTYERPDHPVTVLGSITGEEQDV